jgi:hypothetical protein
MHRSGMELEMMDYGENLADFEGRGSMVSTAEEAVNAWAGEVACWTYGTIEGTEKCDMSCYMKMNSDGCGHYTQIVWRDSMQLGCGVATCQNGQATEDIWICNYAPAGNIIGRAPYLSAKIGENDSTPRTRGASADAVIRGSASRRRAAPP